MFDRHPDMQARWDDELVARMTTANTAAQAQASPVWFRPTRQWAA